MIIRGKRFNIQQYFYLVDFCFSLNRGYGSFNCFNQGKEYCPRYTSSPFSSRLAIKSFPSHCSIVVFVIFYLLLTCLGSKFSLFCLDPFTSSNPADWTAVLGDHHLKERDDRFEQRRKVVNITIHENYKSMWFEGIYDTPPLNDICKYYNTQITSSHYSVMAFKCFILFP